jgi:L-asparaginase/Glu-tRNA(Gln) amidotransferase subunit D
VVRLIATGGTIAMKIDPVKKAPVPAISGEDLIATVPEIKVAGPATSSTPPASASRPPHAGWAR